MTGAFLAIFPSFLLLMNLVVQRRCCVFAIARANNQVGSTDSSSTILGFSRARPLASVRSPFRSERVVHWPGRGGWQPRQDEEFSKRVREMLLMAQLNTSEINGDVKRIKKCEQLNKAVRFFVDNGIEGHFLGQDDIPIAYRLFPKYDTKGTLLPGIVVATGWSECMIKYAEFLHHFWTKGFSVYIYDHRSQGLSGRPRHDNAQVTHVSNFDQYPSDLTTFVEQVVRHEQKKDGPLVFFGHSMGAFSALLAQSEARKMGKYLFQGMALTAPMLQLKTKYGSNTLVRIVSTVAIVLGKGDKCSKGEEPMESPVVRARSTHDIDRKLLWERMRMYLPEVLIKGPSYRWLVESMKAGRKFKRRWKEFDTPVIVFSAGQDDYVNLQHQTEFCVAARNATQILLPEAYHNLATEIDSIRSKVLDTAERFFAGLFNDCMSSEKAKNFNALIVKKSE